MLQKLFERNVLDFLVERGRLSQRLRDDILTNWKHTGFSTDASVRILVGDDEGLRRLVRYIARPPVSFERVTYDDRRGTVTIRSVRKINGERPVVATYDVLTFLALLALQVPQPGTHFTRYYGYYSTRSRAERRQAEQTDAATSGKSAPGQIDPPCAKARRRSWAELLRLVFEVDPMQCECGGKLRVVSFITTAQQNVIDRILDHVGESPETPWSTGPPKWYALQLAQEHVEANPHVYDGFDIDDASYDPDAAWSSGAWDDA